MTRAARERMQVRVPLLAASGVAWLVLLLQPDGAHGGGVCAMPGMQMGASPPSFGALAGGAALMFAAMMLPLLGAPVGHIRDRTFARRRPRAIALFLGSYGLLWTAAGVLLMLLAAGIASAASPYVIAAAILAIALWQFSPAKQRCLNRCHAHGGLAAFGAAADLDVLRLGVRHAAWCIASCSGLMLLPMLFPRAHLASMAAMTLWLASEKLERPMAVEWRLRGPVKIVRIAVGQTQLWLERYAPRLPRRGIASASARASASLE